MVTVGGQECAVVRWVGWRCDLYRSGVGVGGSGDACCSIIHTYI